MKKIKPAYWSILLLIILHFTKDSLERDFPILGMSWEDKTQFLEQGLPLMTPDLDKIWYETRFDFYPRFGVLEQNIGDDGGIYLIFENAGRMNKMFFHIYGKIHPGSAHYEIRTYNSTTTQFFVVNRCEKSGNCQALTECREAVVSNARNLTLSDKAIHISWRKKFQTLNILVQVKNKLFTCKDHNPFEVYKLVMESSERQVIMKKRLSFNKVTNRNWSKELPLNLKANRSVYLQCLQCLYCKTTATLTCENSKNTTAIQGSNDSYVTFGNSMMFTGWNEIILKPENHTDEVNCKLNLSLNFSQNAGENILEKFWIFTEVFYDTDINPRKGDIPECCNSRNSKLTCSKLTETAFGNKKTLNNCTLKVDDVDRCSFERMDVFFLQTFAIFPYPKCLPCQNTSAHLDCRSLDESRGKSISQMFSDCNLTLKDGNETRMCPFQKINVNTQENPCPRFDPNAEGFLKCGTSSVVKQGSDEMTLTKCTLALKEDGRNCTFRINVFSINAYGLCENAAPTPPSPECSNLIPAINLGVNIILLLVLPIFYLICQRNLRSRSGPLHDVKVLYQKVPSDQTAGTSGAETNN